VRVLGAGCVVRVLMRRGASLAFASSTMAKDFTELACWKLSDELRRFVIEVSARPNVARDFRFCNQCKDAARSAPSNIAEGFGRWSHRDFARFLQIAVGSIKETRDLLIDAQYRGYISQDELVWATIVAKRANAACSGLIRYLKNTPDLK
jgi:four helix bundle protein